MDNIQSEIERVGRSVKIELDSYYKVYKGALPFKKVFTKYATTAKKIGFGLAELSKSLEDSGYLRIAVTPNGKRYVISAEADLSLEELIDHVMSLENV